MHAGAAVADRDRAVVTPVDLGALAGSEVQGEEGRGTHRTHALHGKFILILVISFRLSMMGRRLSWAFWRGLGRRM